MPTKRSHLMMVCWLAIIALILTGCGAPELTPSALPLPSFTETAAPTETVTPTPFQPSPTPVPLAVQVNNEEVTLAEFNAELARFRAAQQSDETTSEKVAQERVVNDLINQVLLAQGARENGFSLEEGTLDERIVQLVDGVGGEGAFRAWLADHGYSEGSFRTALARAVAAAWMRDQILAKVPTTAEQIRARQILLYNSGQAREVLEQLQAGNDFATVAAIYNPTAAGDLGWFPRGYLTVPELEEAAFSLQPGEFSDIIQSDLGFHILQVIERDPNRPLEPGARLILKEQALVDWLEIKKNQSEITILLPGGTN